MHPVCSLTSISCCNLDSDGHVAVAMVLMLWDHFIMLGREVAIMWSPRNERVVTKVVHVLNRYVQEAVLIYHISGP